MEWQRIFGLGADADVAALKRAYARVLKENRPDEDPVAFQRVQSAFETGLAQIRRREAGMAARLEYVAPDEDYDEDAWEEDEDEDEDEAPEEDYALPWEAAPRAFPPRVTTPPPRHGEDAPDEVGALLDDLFERASHGDAGAVQAWLEAQDSLYSLVHKREVSERMLHYLSWRGDGLHWKVADVLFRFFEIDGVADARLRQNPGAREVWQRVRADERFEEEQQRLRWKHFGNWVERMVDRELYGAPGGARRRLLLPWVPGAARQVRERYEELEAIDRERAERAFAPGVLDFWLPVSDPFRLHWRRVLPPMLMIVVGSALGSLLLFAGNFSLDKFLGLGGIFAGIGAGIWWAFALFGLVTRRYWRWRNELYGGDPAPAGAPLLSDPYSAFWVVTDLLLMLVATIFVLLGWPDWPLAILVAGYYFSLLGRVQLGDRKRWEEFGFMLATMALALPWTARVFGREIDEAVVLASAALASLALLSFDHWHARLRGRAVQEIRDVLSWPLCVATAAIAALAWWQSP